MSTPYKLAKTPVSSLHDGLVHFPPKAFRLLEMMKTRRKLFVGQVRLAEDVGHARDVLTTLQSGSRSDR